VHTPDGPIEIKGFRVGDLVLSRCEKTGERAYRKVLQVFKHEYDYDDPNAVDIQQYAVRYMLPNGEIGGVYVTGEHPFWVNGMGWVEALQLQAGQELEICDIEAMGEQCDQYRKLGPYSEVILQDRGWTAKVVSVTKTPITKCTVYNLEVEEFHTYFVDSTGIWVHNKNLEKPIDVLLESTDPVAKPIGFKAGTTENPYDGSRIRAGANAKSDISENVSSKIMAEHGVKVVNIPDSFSGNKTGKNGGSWPDRIMDGRSVDIYSPEGSIVRNAETARVRCQT